MIRNFGDGGAAGGEKYRPVRRPPKFSMRFCLAVRKKEIRTVPTIIISKIGQKVKASGRAERTAGEREGTKMPEQKNICSLNIVRES